MSSLSVARHALVVDAEDLPLVTRNSKDFEGLEDLIMIVSI
jgi:hypothetical protein